MAHVKPPWMKSAKGSTFTGIGSLEAEILAIVWEKDSTTVRDVYETLRERRVIAYTTVMTVMNNLVKKKLLNQNRDNIAYLYTPAMPGDEVANTILDSVVNTLMGSQPNLAISHLLGLKTNLTAEQTEELKKYIEKNMLE